MTLTVKEIATLEVLNKKGLVYEYVEVQALGTNGMTTVNKLVKIEVKKEKHISKPIGKWATLNLPENQVYSGRTFVKTEEEIKGQAIEKAMNLPSSLRKY